ncbi:MAG: hypothetical protein HZB51_23635 [Chloroflexi bacterium]|nr:hypothetical protein [Chloroflexota bacterium]
MSDDTPLETSTPMLFDVSMIPLSNTRLEAHKAWIRGDEESQIAHFLQDVDFTSYREKVLERGLPWGMSAISRFLSNLAVERGISLPSGLEYLPSIIKYGVPHPLACRFVRMGFSRSGAKKMLKLLFRSDPFQNVLGIENLTIDDFSWSHDTALLLLQKLEEEDFANLQLSTEDMEKIRKIQNPDHQ